MKTVKDFIWKPEMSVEEVVPGEKGKRYVTFRNRGGGLLNDNSPSSAPLPAIIGSGVDYYDRVQRRCVPVAILQACQTFPANWVWPTTVKSQIVKRIANSVPPLFMKAIAEHIKDNILSKIEVQAA